MKPNVRYAKKLQEEEGYQRAVLAFKRSDTPPENAQSYGTDVSFLCAIVQEVWEEKQTVYLTNQNVLCGGSVYAGIGTRKLTKEDFDGAMDAVIGKNMAYCSRESLRRVNQQLPHFFKHRKYFVVGLLENVEDPDVVMIVANANQVMRLCKAYTWKTGELVQALGGTAWCAQSFPPVYRSRTMTYNLGDPPARTLMGLADDEVFCTIHYDLLPEVLDNLPNISAGTFGY